MILSSFKRVIRFLDDHKDYVGLAFILGFCLMPSDAVAGLEEQLTKVNTLLTGPLLKVGLGGSTILGCIYAAAKGALGMAAAIMGVGVALSYYLGWIQGDSFIST